MKKTLINEVLPAPSPKPAVSLRDRVKRHAQNVIKASALTGTATLAGCIGGGGEQDAGYTVVDPLPAPCPRFDRLENLTGTATIHEQAIVTVRIASSAYGSWGDAELVVRNEEGARRLGTPSVSRYGELVITSTFMPAAGATSFSYVVDFSCTYPPPGGAASLLVRVTLSSPLPDLDGGPVDAGTITATVDVTELQDAGP